MNEKLCQYLMCTKKSYSIFYNFYHMLRLRGQSWHFSKTSVTHSYNFSDIIIVLKFTDG